MPYADKVYLTMVVEEKEHVDAYFPHEILDESFDWFNFERHYCTERNLNYMFVDYVRKAGDN